jgi:hypothetical protein
MFGVAGTVAGSGVIRLPKSAVVAIARRTSVCGPRGVCRISIAGRWVGWIPVRRISVTVGGVAIIRARWRRRCTRYASEYPGRPADRCSERCCSSLRESFDWYKDMICGGPPPAAAPMAAPEAAPQRPPAKPRWTGSYGLVQAERPNAKMAITQGTIRFIRTFPRSSIKFNRRADAGSSHPFYQRIQQRSRKPSRRAVREDFVETVKTSFEPEMAHQRASEWLRIPRISTPDGLYSGSGRPNVGRTLRRTKARGDLRSRCRGLQPPDGAR